MSEPFGDFYEEIWTGLGTDLAMNDLGHVRVWTRPDTKMVFFYSAAGIVTAQKIESLEFDGWELFVGPDHTVQRFDGLKKLQSAILSSLRTIEEQNDL